MSSFIVILALAIGIYIGTVLVFLINFAIYTVEGCDQLALASMVVPFSILTRFGDSLFKLF